MAAGSSIMLRRLVDNCADVAEAIDYARTSDLTPADWQSCHLFVTDAAGRSVVLESRNGELSAVETDVVTNFYVGSDDAADSYLRGGACARRPSSWSTRTAPGATGSATAMATTAS